MDIKNTIIKANEILGRLLNLALHNANPPLPRDARKQIRDLTEEGQMMWHSAVAQFFSCYLKAVTPVAFDVQKQASGLGSLE